MNLTLFGANGAIGAQVAQFALQAGHQVTAYIRQEGALNIQHANLQIIVGQYNETVKIDEAIQQSDVVISTLGPTLSMSRKVEALPITTAHQAIISSMERLGKKRFITLGTPSIQAQEDTKQIVTVVPGMMAKLLYPTGYQEMQGIGKLLTGSSLDWTVIRIINPNVKSDGSGYAISFGSTKGKMGVSRANVARCMIEATAKDEWIHKMPIVFNR
ncbi:NAD(P)-dependent oxidoreductase [Lysinibacillus sp. NPDC097287]|uniref:NAD(P)-dependent oxidoreductase n=1 Tax=Lysinibacillus sp. NPDC097287 TaxID=3364144 RepID=UPI00382C2717